MSDAGGVPIDNGVLLLRELDLLAGQVTGLRGEVLDGLRDVRADVGRLDKRVAKIERVDQSQADRIDERRRWCRHLLAAQAAAVALVGLVTGIASLAGWI